MNACPHCHSRVVSLTAHLRDTGAATTLPYGACPVLFIGRNRLHLAPPISHVTAQPVPYDWAKRDPELAAETRVTCLEWINVDGCLVTTLG